MSREAGWSTMAAGWSTMAAGWSTMAAAPAALGLEEGCPREGELAATGSGKGCTERGRAVRAGLAIAAAQMQEARLGERVRSDRLLARGG